MKREPVMELRQLGRSEIRVAPLCLGGNVFGWTADEATSFDILDRFVAGGLNFIDTANMYSTWVPGHRGGESEAIIGRWMKARRNRNHVVIATKVGMEMGDGTKGLAPASIQKAVEDSLRRLQIETIDLYQSHIDDPETPLADTLAAYARLIEAGKVRAIGASNYGPARLREALELSAAEENLPRYESLQPEYNLATRSGYEAELEPLCREHQVGVIPFYSLASGFLTGKYRSDADFGKSPRGERMGRYLNERGLRILAALDAVAAELDSTPAQVALAWLIARPGLTAPIASATSVAQVDDLVAATRLRLTPEAVHRLDQASAGD